MKKNFETHEKIQNYWSAVKDSDNQSQQHTSQKLGENDLLSREIEDTIHRGERVLGDAVKFVDIIRSLTKQARGLNENFSKARTIKLKGGLNDPLLKKYERSGVMSRIMQNEKPTNADWKKTEQKLRSSTQESVTVSQNMRVYSTFIDQLIENDGYLCKILDQNYSRLITKMKDYEIFNEALEQDEAILREGTQYKYDFSAEIKGGRDSAESKSLNLRTDLI